MVLPMGYVVTVSENDHKLNYHLLRLARDRFKVAPAELPPEQYELVNRLAHKEYSIEELVLTSDEAADVVIPDSVVDSAIETVATRYADRNELYSDLEKSGLSESVYQRAICRELKVQAVLDKVASRMPEISDTDIEIFYYMHQEKFMRPETRSARHILVTINPDFPENSRGNARAHIEQVARRLSKKPQRFGEQAAKHSECPTAMNEGVLGRIPRGQLFEALDEVLFFLDEGGLSGAVESPLGFHLLFCEAIHPAGLVPLQEAAPKIREKLEARERRKLQSAWLGELRTEMKSG